MHVWVLWSYSYTIIGPRVNRMADITTWLTILVIVRCKNIDVCFHNLAGNCRSEITVPLCLCTQYFKSELKGILGLKQTCETES